MRMSVPRTWVRDSMASQMHVGSNFRPFVFDQRNKSLTLAWKEIRYDELPNNQMFLRDFQAEGSLEYTRSILSHLSGMMYVHLGLFGSQIVQYWSQNDNTVACIPSDNNTPHSL